MEIFIHLLNKAKHYDVKIQVKISREEDESKQDTSRERKKLSRTVEEEGSDN